MDEILKMPEGKEKEEKMALAKKESPLLFAGPVPQVHYLTREELMDLVKSDSKTSNRKRRLVLLPPVSIKQKHQDDH